MAYDWTITPAGPPNTPIGTDVTVTVAGATVGFGTVATAGFTGVTELAGSSPLPAGYLAAGARFFEIGTTAAVSGSLSVCLSYGSLAEPVRLLHFDGSVLVDVTTTNDVDAGPHLRRAGQPVGVRDRHRDDRRWCPTRRSSPGRRPRPSC